MAHAGQPTGEAGRPQGPNHKAVDAPIPQPPAAQRRRRKKAMYACSSASTATGTHVVVDSE